MIKVVREKFKTDLGRELFDRISQISDDQEFLLNVFLNLKTDHRKEIMKKILDCGECDPERIFILSDIIHCDILLHHYEYLDLLSKSLQELEQLDYQLSLKYYERLKQKFKNERMRELAEQENFED